MGLRGPAFQGWKNPKITDGDGSVKIWTGLPQSIGNASDAVALEVCFLTFGRAELIDIVALHAPDTLNEMDTCICRN